MVMGLTFTYPMSLSDWVSMGLLDREKRIYEEHLRQNHFNKIIWFTYGYGDEELRDQLVEEGKLDERIEVVGLPGWAKSSIMRFIYSMLLPVIRDSKCRKLSIIKSNQMGGARVAAAIKKRFKIPFELRTGYTYSLFHKKELEFHMSIWKRIRKEIWYRYYVCEENRLFKECTTAFVSSVADKDYILSTYDISQDKIHLLTNYIDCERFSIITPFENRKNRFLFVGRLSRQKNLYNLINAFSDLSIGIDIYGSGEQEDELKQHALDKKVDVTFFGRVDNDILPKIYNKYKYYILPSLYEGMPKTLLEAMSCGCVCFGTEVEGNREVIQNGTTGFIINGTGADDIREKIKTILSGGNNEVMIGYEASNYIRNKHSLKSVAEKEWEVIRCLV